jgi:hypothetical protein
LQNRQNILNPSINEIEEIPPSAADHIRNWLLPVPELFTISPRPPTAKDWERPVVNLLDIALEHHHAGRAVISVRKNKIPYYSGFKKWFAEPQTEEEVRDQFHHDAYGIALLLYPATEYCCLDFDGPHAQNAWDLTGIALPSTSKDLSPSGGWHAIYKIASYQKSDFKRYIRIVKANCGCVKTCGVDFLINGHLVIPPTPNYRSECPLESAAVIPDAVLELHRENINTGSKSHDSTNGFIYHGERKVRLTSIAGTMRRKGMSLESIRAALEAENLHRFKPPIEQNHIEDVLKSVITWTEGAETMKCTDLGNAQRLVRKFGPDLHYSFQSGWYVWDGKYWAKDEDGEVMRKAKETVREIHLEAAACVDNVSQKRLNNHAHNSEAKNKLESMIDLAQSEPGIPIHQTELDPDIFLLNVANGTLDLRTGELRPHRHIGVTSNTVAVGNAMKFKSGNQWRG